MNLIPLLSSWWPPAGGVLFSLSGTDVTIGGLLVLCVLSLIGLLLQKPFARLVIRVAQKRGLEDERVLTFIGDVAGAVILLMLVWLGLDLGQVITFRQFTDALFGLLNFSLFQIAGTPISLMTIVTVTAVMMVASWVSRLLQSAVRKTVTLKLNNRINPGSLKAVERLLHYLVLMLGLGVGLQTAGVNLSALFAASAVFAVGVGFAMQNIAQNFVSGVIVLAEQAIRPGDILEVDGQVVRVEEMGIRSTVVRTLDEEFLIVPNSLLAQNTVKNYSLKKGILRVRAVVGVSYGADLKQVETVLTAAATTVSDQVDGHPPLILLKEFGSSSVNFEVSVWIRTPWDLQLRSSELRTSIWWALKEAGITIAFPQIDVHFDSSVSAPLQLLTPRV